MGFVWLEMANVVRKIDVSKKIIDHTLTPRLMWDKRGIWNWVRCIFIQKSYQINLQYRHAQADLWNARSTALTGLRSLKKSLWNFMRQVEKRTARLFRKLFGPPLHPSTPTRFTYLTALAESIIVAGGVLTNKTPMKSAEGHGRIRTRNVKSPSKYRHIISANCARLLTILLSLGGNKFTIPRAPEVSTENFDSSSLV